MDNLHVCWRCGDWPDVSYELEGARWCGPCAPWARVPCPLAGLLEFGARVIARLDREGLVAARSDAERLVAWLEAAAAAWPGPDPWRTVRLATQMQHRLLVLERLRSPAAAFDGPRPAAGGEGVAGAAQCPVTSRASAACSASSASTKAAIMAR